jgi:metal-dependent amidase/aminoacylase/carboxypeptidase family protein
MVSICDKDGLTKFALDSLDKSIAEVRDDLHDIQRALHAKPELAFEEHFAHDTCSAYMKKQGFQVTTSAHGLATAWRAEYEVGQGGPVVGYNSESELWRHKLDLAR